MQKKFFITIVTLLSLSFAQLVLAKTMLYPPQPAQCPGVAAIKTYGVSRNAFEVKAGLWTTGRRDFIYDTLTHWSFVIENIPATTSNEAYNKAVVGLSSLILQIGPITGPFNTWICLYNSTEGYVGATITPPISPTNATQYI